MIGPWWERHPGRLEFELDALREAGIEFEQDDGALALGIVRLNLQFAAEGERLPLVVTFPDLYPFFRFEVDAPTLDLAHHQNPLGKNLCLIGRGTHHWNPSDTLAGLLQQQLPTVLDTGRSADKEAARGLEQEQAEPLSAYYPYPASLVIVQEGLEIPGEIGHGTFVVATQGPQGPIPEHFLRGALAEVRGADGEFLARADRSLLSAYMGDRVAGYWVRVPEPIRSPNQKQFLEEILRRFPSARSAQANRVSGGWLQVWGVIFPEESKWREDGDGWMFVCLFEPQRARMVSPTRLPPPRTPDKRHAHKAKKRRKR